MVRETSWEKLTISNNYLFLKVMRNERICKKMIEKILDIKVEKISYPEEEKEINIRLDSKSVRLDVYVQDEKGTVFNIEMQTSESRDNLAKRTRYYQGLIDMDLLEKGELYEQLKPTYIIFICTFDLFHLDRHIYTFRNLCAEDHTLELNDETTKIFLNSKGKSDDVSPDIKAFLQYVEGVLTEDPFIQEIESEVARVKGNTEWRREYMTLEMELRKREQQGREEGMAQKAKVIAINMLKSNMDIAAIAECTELSIEEIEALAKKMKILL